MSMSEQEALSILGLSSACASEDIRNRFRFLSFSFHPDRFPEQWKSLANEKMIAIIAAREALQNYNNLPPTQTSQNREENSRKEATAPAGKSWKPCYSPGPQLCNGSRCRELFIQPDEPAILDGDIYYHPWCWR